MAHFAQLDNTNTVLQVITFTAPDGSTGETECSQFMGGGTWLQTSYHNNIRKNYAGIGYTYDSVRDAFIAPKPDSTYVLDETTCQWIVPQ